MYTTCIISLLLHGAQLAASAAIPLSALSSDSISISEDSRIPQQQQNTTPWTPPLQLLPPTSKPPNTTTTPTPTIIIPIPNTDLYLRITYTGKNWIATTVLAQLFTSAHAQIQEPVARHPDDAVAPLPWFHSIYSKQWGDTIAIRVRGNGDKMCTWLQLDCVLTALRMYMEGGPTRLHPVNFDVDSVREGIVAVGVLWYSQSRPPRAVEEGEAGVIG